MTSAGRGRLEEDEELMAPDGEEESKEGKVEDLKNYLLKMSAKFKFQRIRKW